MNKTFLALVLLIAGVVAAHAQPSPAPSPVVAATSLTASDEKKVEKKDEKKTDKNTAEKKAANLKKDTPPTPAPAHPVINLPPEKANPVRIPKLDKPPVIDGKLDDEVWKQAIVLKDFYQTSPGDNIEPSRKTDTMIAYDAKFLYFAFRCYDEPDKVRATVAKRDNVFGEDNVRVYLDTFNDQRRAYVLGFNPFGIQQDGIYTEGSGTDYNFDIVMESKGVMTSDGWTVEVAIPFKSLRYTAGKDKQWGIQVWRNIDRFNDEVDSWMPNNRDNASLLNQEGHLTGLEGIQTQRQLEVTPSLTVSEKGKRIRTFSLASLGNDPTLLDPGHFVNRPVKLEPGVTVKLGITPTITVDAAINPDFAQVEADSTVILANQRFPVFFPEKRPFFLEGIDYFQTPIAVVHTRTIADPDFAFKLTGKQGRNTFAALVASDNFPGGQSRFPEEDRLDPDFAAANGKYFDKNSLVGVLRLKRDIGKDSSIGMIATTYNFPDSYNNVAGIDGRFRINPRTIFQFQVLGTRTHQPFFNPNFLRDRLEIGDPTSGVNVDRVGVGLAYYWLLDYTGRRFGYFVSGLGRTADYRAKVGFTRRVNSNLNEFFWRYNTEDNPKAKFIIRKQIHNYNSINYDFRGRLQNYFNEVVLSFNLQHSTFFQTGVNYGYERIFEEEFGFRRLQSTGELGTFSGDDPERSTYHKQWWAYGERNFNKKVYAYMFLGYTWGQTDFDFGGGPRYPRVSPSALADGPFAPLDPGGGNALDVDTGVTYKPTNPLNMFLGFTKSRLVRKDNGRVAFDDNIFVLRGTYQFTRFTFARARIDYESLSSRVLGQLLFGWAPNPGTAFYVGYNDDFNYNGFNQLNDNTFNFDRHFFEPGISRNGREFFIKFSYLFRKSF
ncbi:MAG TPA: DUF5916 domain-containing protein [Pyrinomonadaceae bacterium]